MSEDTLNIGPQDAGEPDILRTTAAGPRAVRGGAILTLSYSTGSLITALASIVVVRYLGIIEFGQYVTVMAIVAVVSGLSDAGLTVVGTRELAALPPGPERRAVLADLAGIRLAITPLAVAAAVGFAVIVGYPQEIVLGVLVAGAGLALIAGPLALFTRLPVEMHNGRLAAGDLLRQSVISISLIAFALGGAALDLFFFSQIIAGLAVIAATPLLVGRSGLVRPTMRRHSWRRLLSRSIPLAIAYTLSLVYFRVLLIILSLTASATETGIFGTSLRTLELLLGLPILALGAALPVLTAARADFPRFRYQVQRLTETAILAGAFVAVVVCLAAEPIVEVIGGSDYDAVPDVLRVHVFAFIPLFFGYLGQIVLLALDRQQLLIRVNAIAIVFLIAVGMVVVPRYEAPGAAWAAVGCECFLAMIIYVVLRRQPEGIAPSLGGIWRVAVATVAALGAGMLSGLSPIPGTILGVSIFVALAYLLRAIPVELADALPWRRHRLT